jgi:hypothetical protein
MRWPLLRHQSWRELPRKILAARERLARSPIAINARAPISSDAINGTSTAPICGIYETAGILNVLANSVAACSSSNLAGDTTKFGYPPLEAHRRCIDSLSGASSLRLVLEREPIPLDRRYVERVGATGMLYDDIQLRDSSNFLLLYSPGTMSLSVEAIKKILDQWHTTGAQFSLPH